ncbi:MAG: efflux RND transporter periplasmic adaptor subunit [Chitinophagaceae bacterium]
MKAILIPYGFLLCILVGCSVKGKDKNAEDTAQTFPVLTLKQTDTVLQQGYVADINAAQNVDIRAKVTGFIDKILIDEGHSVKKGQVLFLLNDAEHRSEYAKASAILANSQAEEKAAELELKRVKLLVDKKVVTPSEYELAEAKVKSAQAKVNEALSVQENATIMLSYTKIKAPFDGIINRIPLKLGSLVTEGTLLTSVSDLSSVYAYFNVSENEYLHLIQSSKSNKSVGSDVHLQLANGQDYPYTGEVETMETEFNESTGAIAIRARFPNPQHLLKHGATGTVKFQSRINALIVPQKAVMEIQDKNFVFVVTPDNTVKMKSFTAKARAEDFFIVQTGLSPGDRVVYEGIQNIQDGSRITPRNISADSLVAVN